MSERGDDITRSRRLAVLVADDALAAAASAQAAATAQVDVAAQVGWATARQAIADRPAAAIVIAEAAGRADAQLVNDLIALADAAEQADAGLIVVFARAQLDLVAGALLDRPAILLCDPNSVERISALAMAVAPRDGRVRDQSHETERLRRLNDDVARLAATLAALVQSDDDDQPGARPGAPPMVGDRALGFAAQPAAIDPTDIRRTIRARRLRSEVFGIDGLFEDPAWDMLLDLFAAELERRQVSVSSLCIAAAVAPTTALRWIGRMMEAGLLDRRPDDRDRRRAFIALTARASTGMRNYVAAARRAQLDIV